MPYRHHGAANRINRLLMGIILASGLGCQKGPVPTYPVRGTITVTDDSSLAGGRVEFRLVENPHHLVSRGHISKTGNYSLGTFDIKDGAPAGKHRVIVYPPFPPGDFDANPKFVSIIDPKYLAYETSGLEVDVTTDEEKNVFNFSLARNPNR